MTPTEYLIKVSSRTDAVQKCSKMTPSMLVRVVKFLHLHDENTRRSLVASIFENLHNGDDISILEYSFLIQVSVPWVREFDDIRDPKGHYAAYASAYKFEMQKKSLSSNDDDLHDLRSLQAAIVINFSTKKTEIDFARKMGTRRDIGTERFKKAEGKLEDMASRIVSSNPSLSTIDSEYLKQKEAYIDSLDTPEGILISDCLDLSKMTFLR